jgi:hypothetical protein
MTCDRGCGPLPHCGLEDDRQFLCSGAEPAGHFPAPGPEQVVCVVDRFVVQPDFGRSSKIA